MNLALASARRVVADSAEVQEFFQHNGWSDGLPIIPPTVELVEHFIAAADLEVVDGFETGGGEFGRVLGVLKRAGHTAHP